jgi:archaellum component FlaC
MTKAQLEEMLNDTANKFNKIIDEIESRQNIINEKQQEISELIDEQKRLQGEYRVLVRVGKAFHFFDDEDVKEDVETGDVKDSSQEVEA